jgi:hypothetical protein
MAGTALCEFREWGSIYSAVGLGREWSDTEWLWEQLGILTFSYSLVNTGHLRALCVLLSTVTLPRYGPVGCRLGYFVWLLGGLGMVMEMWIC